MKCNLIIINHDNQTINIRSEAVEASESVELLGIKIDKYLNFTKGYAYFHLVLFVRM